MTTLRQPLAVMWLGNSLSDLGQHPWALAAIHNPEQSSQNLPLNLSPYLSSVPKPEAPGVPRCSPQHPPAPALGGKNVLKGPSHSTGQYEEIGWCHRHQENFGAPYGGADKTGHPMGTLSLRRLRRALRHAVWVTRPEDRRNSAAYIHTFFTYRLPPPLHTHHFFLLFD